MDDVEINDNDEIIGNKNGLQLLNYERDVLTKTLPASVLFVTASGLGIERLFLEHLILFSDRRLLTIVLNANQHDEAYFISKLKEHDVDCEPKVINSEVSIKDRQSIYLEGGVQFCSSRVILVDLLQSRIPVNKIAAIFVYRAHQVLTSFQDSFILRLYREKKPNGMVKTFTDNPMSFSSLGQLQRLIDRLYVRHVELLPRFSMSIENEMSLYQLRSAVFSVDVTPSLRRVHRTLVDFIKVCVRDLRACSSSGKQVGEENEEMVHVPWATTQLEKRLKSRRGFITDKQTRLLNDTASLREILQMSENLDAATVLSRLMSLKNDKTVLEEHSGWLISPSFNRVLEELTSICGITNGKGDFKKFSPPSKWTVLTEVLTEIKGIEVEGGSEATTLIISNSEEVSRQITDVVKYGINKTKWMTWRQLGHRNIQEVPEDEPLWSPENVAQLIRSQLETEPKSDIISNCQKSQKTVARAAQKRRKAAEELTVNTTDSTQIQTSLIQFGILQYKRKRSTEATSTSNEQKVKEEVDEDGESKEMKKIGDMRDAELVICTSHDYERYTFLKLLEQKKPQAIVLYTMSVQTLRQIEIYRATHPTRSLQVYCLQYRESTEESRYLEGINRETLAFESLIREQGTLMIAREFNVEREEAPRIKSSTRDGGGDRRELMNRQDPRDQEGNEEDDRPKIIVDMREFNSELPTVLYTKGYNVIAATLEIGDYILSPDVAVERKALDDLAQSLQSGRVFKQIEQMLEHYECSVLLIESNRKFETKIVNGGPFQGELSRHCREIRSKLCSLINTHPKMKCIWTMSPENSAEMFIELKLNGAEPNVEEAVGLKSDKMEDQADQSDDPEKKKRKKEGKINSTLLRSLTNHLGLKAVEAQKVMKSEVTSLVDLFTSSSAMDKLKGTMSEDKFEFLEYLTTLDFSKA